MQNFKEKLGIGKNKKTFAFVIILIAIPVAIGLVGFIQQKTQKDTEVLAANQVNDLLGKVGKLMDVPDETPTVATVSDISKLSGQEFFAKAQNGDKVIIFPKAQKAILYRPGTDKIIEVAFYSPPTSPAPTQGAVSVSPTPGTRSLQDLIGKPSVSSSPSLSPTPSSQVISPSPTPTP